jgi:hypothetical protein
MNDILAAAHDAIAATLFDVEVGVSVQVTYVPADGSPPVEIQGIVEYGENLDE